MASDRRETMIASIKQAKSMIRQQMKQKLKQLSRHDKDLQSAIIQQKVLTWEVYKTSQRISIFLPMQEEVDTIPILKLMLNSGKHCFIPNYKGSEMIMVHLESWEAYEKLPSNSWGIKQPAEFDMSQDAILSGGLDLILMPGLAFTEAGVRLGRGKGFYDKYVQKCADSGRLPHTAGLTFREQVLEDIPRLEHDILLDNVIYPTQQELQQRCALTD